MNESEIRNRVKEIVRETLVEENEYQKFFQAVLTKHGGSIKKMGTQEKRDFFDKIDAAWNSKGEKASKVKEKVLPTKSSPVFEATKPNNDAKKFLKGMKKVKVNGLKGYMPGVDYVYQDKKGQWWFVDFEGDQSELNNIETLKQLKKLMGGEPKKGASSEDKAYFKKHKKELMKILDDDLFANVNDVIAAHRKQNESVNEAVVNTAHGNGTVVATKRKLKADADGTWGSGVVKDLKKKVTLKKGTEIDGIVKLKDGRYVAYKHKVKASDVGIKSDSNIVATWESLPYKPDLKIEKDLKDYEQLWKQHDFHYQRSDDRRYYRAGVENLERINNLKHILLKKGVNQKVLDKIKSKYTPK